MAGWIDGMMEGWSIEVFSMCLDAFVMFGDALGGIGGKIRLRRRNPEIWKFSFLRTPGQPGTLKTEKNQVPVNFL